MSLASLYEHHADECARAAEQAEDPNQRAMLLRIANEWRRDAQRLREQATEPATQQAEERARPVTTPTSSGQLATNGDVRNAPAPRREPPATGSDEQMFGAE
jgi:hypothetical protein